MSLDPAAVAALCESGWIANVVRAAEIAEGALGRAAQRAQEQAQEEASAAKQALPTPQLKSRLGSLRANRAASPRKYLGR